MNIKFLLIEFVTIPVAAILLLYLFSMSGMSEWCNEKGLGSLAGLMIGLISIVIGVSIAEKFD